MWRQPTTSREYPIYSLFPELNRYCSLFPECISISPTMVQMHAYTELDDSFLYTHNQCAFQRMARIGYTWLNFLHRIRTRSNPAIESIFNAEPQYLYEKLPAHVQSVQFRDVFNNVFTFARHELLCKDGHAYQIRLIDFDRCIYLLRQSSNRWEWVETMPSLQETWSFYYQRQTQSLNCDCSVCSRFLTI